jgi:uncharacterized lipoprotein YmbA
VITRRLCALLIVLGGCRALLPAAPRSEFFLLTALEPPSGAGSGRAVGPSVLVGPVVLPQYLDRPEMVTRLASNQVRVEELELWAEPLRDSIARTLGRNLAALLDSGGVQREPWTGPAPPDLVVSVEVRRFEKTSAGQIELAARWTIDDRRGGGEPTRGQTRVAYPAVGTTTQAAVASMSDALAALSREIAASVQRLARGDADADAVAGPGRLDSPSGTP